MLPFSVRVTLFRVPRLVSNRSRKPLWLISVVYSALLKDRAALAEPTDRAARTAAARIFFMNEAPVRNLRKAVAAWW